MKFIFSILAILLTAKECNQKNTEIDAAKSELAETMKQQQQEECTFVYTASTRGFYKEVLVSNSGISIKNSRGSENTITKSINEKTWDSLMHKLSNFNVKEVSKLQAPSTKRFSDGAAMATLKIVYPDTTYVSQEFDHGNPPDELKSLCNEILELSDAKKE